MAGIDYEGYGSPHFTKQEIAALSLPLRLIYKTNLFCVNHLNIGTILPCLLTTDIAEYAEERMLKKRKTEQPTNS